ncbi:MAG TPA: c-type cytochrome [Terracidiphilus sp.]|jgi:hypothetical protein
MHRSRPIKLIRLASWSAVALVAAIPLALMAQTLIYNRKPDPKIGEVIYKGGCIACHGADGKGASQALTEFKRPDTWPDFSRCDQTTPEANYTWKAIILNGGPYLGFSTIMPSFRDQLSNARSTTSSPICAPSVPIPIGLAANSTCPAHS